MENLLHLFKSLSFVTAMKIVIIKLVRKIINIPLTLTFAQAGEDMILQHLLVHKKNGFYLDIGCNEPIKLSNTFHFYLMGWSGICVDANKKITDAFKKIRKNDIVVQAAVSDVIEDKVFHVSETSAVSTLDDELITDWSKKWSFKENQKELVRTNTLTNILDEYLPLNQEIDLLSIDVEGYDFKVLKSLDLTKYRPKIIVIEIHDFDLMNMSQNMIVTYLGQHNYELKYYATINAYFTLKGAKFD